MFGEPTLKGEATGRLIFPILLFLFIGIPIIIKADDISAKSDLVLSVKFLSDPPYQTSWWPWSDDHFIVETSICNNYDHAWAISPFTPCYDCNPKFHLEDIQLGKEAKRTNEVDVYWILKSCYKLDSHSCYVDTMDIANWINYDLEKGKQYRFWIDYIPSLYYQKGDSSEGLPIWKDNLVSDTLAFIHK